MAILAAALVATLLPARPATACGPFLLEARFWPSEATGVPWPSYATGELGVVVAGQRPWDLFVAWSHLGPPLHAPTLAAIASLPDPAAATTPDPLDPPATQRWLDARLRVPGAAEGAPTWIDTTRWIETPREDGSLDMAWIENCLPDAFVTAAETLERRIAAWGAGSEAAAEWLRGQDRVFARCSGAGPLPDLLDGGSWPALLHQDRGYQRAAAHFYGLDLAAAEAAFRALGDDATSPWRQTARYLVARAQARDGRPREAVATLEALLADPAQAPFHDSIRGLLRHYRARYEAEAVHREARAALLAGAVAGEDPLEWAQAWIDFDRTPREPAHDLDLWLAVMAGDEDEPEPAEAASSRASLALARWRATGSRRWLVAALATAGRETGGGAASGGTEDEPLPPDDAAEPGAPAPADSPSDTASGTGTGTGTGTGGSLDDLLAAAAAVPDSAPEALTVAWHRARLLLDLDRRGEAREVLDEVLDALPARNPRHRATLNRVSVLRARAAAGLDDLLAHAQLRPHDVGFDEGRWYAVEPETGDEANPAGELAAAPPVLLADLAVPVLNSLATVERVALVEGGGLHPDLRSRAARATWTRAVLLGQHDLAARLSPVLERLEPPLARDLAGHRTATPEDRPFAAALLLLRFPGLHPDLHGGLPREEPLAEIDALRRNWWCAGEELVPPASFAPPPWMLSAPDDLRRRRAEERDSLRVQDPAPRALALQVLERADLHPDDPRVPEALHRVVLATRHGCPWAEGYGSVSRAAFRRLHERYPDDPWTARTPYWFD